MGRAMTKPEPRSVTEEPASYGEAAAELETILERIEHGRADLDELSEQVGRAADLIRFCRDRIDGTEMKVRKVIEQLEGSTAAPPPENADDAEQPWS